MGCWENLRVSIEEDMQPPVSGLKFNGISFGGRFGGCKIFGKKFWMIVGRDKKNQYGFSIHKIRKRDYASKYFFFLLFVFLDFLIFTIDNPPPAVIMLINWLDSVGENINNAVSNYMPTVETSPTFEVLSWVFFMSTLFLFIWLFSFRGLKRWHGLEHKAIASAEAGDVENYEKYSTINKRCGGTYLLSIYAYLFISIYFVIIILGLPGYGVYSMTGFLMFAESRWFHKYNVIGIWFGCLLQKYCTTKEPFQWQNKIGKSGISELVKAERGEPFTEKLMLFNKKHEEIKAC